MIVDRPAFWYLNAFGTHFCQALQTDIARRNLFDELLTGPIGAAWIPPPYSILRRRVWPDWMPCLVPLLSDRALGLLREYVTPCSELLPWIDEPDHRYTLINVTTKIPRHQWSCDKSSVHGDVIANADGIHITSSSIPHVFTLEGYRGKMFVSDELAQRSVTNGLTGVAFIDPLIPGMRLSFIPHRFGKTGTGFIRSGADH
jgi:hypothetical protein